jgi:hypothetical protein
MAIGKSDNGKERWQHQGVVTGRSNGKETQQEEAAAGKSDPYYDLILQLLSGILLRWFCLDVCWVQASSFIIWDGKLAGFQEVVMTVY